jgi:hypothetical protein
VVFESVVEKIVIGGYNDEEVEEPLKITFVYKTGIHTNFNRKLLSQSVTTLRLYIMTQNCVPVRVTRLKRSMGIRTLQTGIKAVVPLLPSDVNILEDALSDGGSMKKGDLKNEDCADQ